MVRIHARMPVMLPEGYPDAWQSGEAGKEILVPYPADGMKSWAISPRNNDPRILEPVG
jgi:putative SOS response-associated peptidase YedK